MRLPWGPSFESGHALIDAQHRGLVELLNAMHLAIPNGHADVMRVTDAFSGALGEHFATEERLMEETHYPHLEVHRTVHVRLRNDLAVLLRSFGLGRGFVVEGSEFLTRWLQHHISREDRETAQWILARQRAGCAS